MRTSATSTTTLLITKEMKEKVIRFVKYNGSITNKECRRLLEIGYDQAITLFNLMVKSNELVRVGKTSSIKYVLPPQKAEK
jgi:predicted HTH transcriptional regulator